MKIKEEKKKSKNVQNSKSEEVEEQPSITEQNKLKQKQKQLPSHSDSDSDPDYGSPYVSDSEVITSSLSLSQLRYATVCFSGKKYIFFCFLEKVLKTIFN